MTYQLLRAPYCRFVCFGSLFLMTASLCHGDPHAAPAVKDVTETDPQAAAALEAQLISNPRQLTFEGRRAGEGYFSADGNKMVFQSERLKDNPFFQIYLLDFETGDIERVSPGHGKTTCAWIHPTGDRVLFASTHDDPAAKSKQRAKLDLRASGQDTGYSWSFDSEFEIVEYDVAKKTYAKLTSAKGLRRGRFLFARR